MTGPGTLDLVSFTAFVGPRGPKCKKTKPTQAFLSTNLTLLGKFCPSINASFTDRGLIL